MYFISRTGPFRVFQRRVGDTTFHINSAYIGLEWIARGYGIPDGLEINWSPPKQPKQSVDQARSLLHSAILSHVFDALDSYLRDVAAEAWLPLTTEQRDILRKAVTRPGGEEYSITDRFIALHVCPDCKATTDLALVAALVAWRNQTIHSRPGGKLRLDEPFEEQLIQDKIKLGKRFGDLDPGAMLDHMRNREPPKRKEIVALVSASQNLTRAIDEGLLSAALQTSAEVQNVAKAAIASALCRGEKLNEIKKLWGKDPDARCRRLRAILQEYGFVDRPETQSPTLPSTFIEDMARLSLDDALSALGVTS